MKRILTIGLVLTVLTATACGSDDDRTESTTNTTTATTTLPPTPAAAPEFGDADVSFAQNMIPHHAQAVEMAEIALDPAVAAGPDVTDLATGVRDAQDPEIELMRSWLDQWGMPMDDSDMDQMDDMDHSGMDGMMTAGEMDELRGATGADFDRLWLELMIRHHEGAIAMAEAVKADGVNSHAISLGDAISTAQRQEIDEMRALLDD